MSVEVQVIDKNGAIEMFGDFEEINKHLDVLFKRLSFTTLAQIKTRVFVDGKMPNGVLIDGNGYSKAYAGLRRKKGKQTSRVNLQFSSQLFSSINAFANNKNGQIGISQDGRREKLSNTDLLGYLTKRYGDFMDLSKEEEKNIDKIVDVFVDDVINNKF